MCKRNNNSVSLKNPQNKTDVKKQCLTKELVDVFEGFTKSKSLKFVNLCNGNCEKSCDEKSIQIYKRFAKQGG